MGTNTYKATILNHGTHLDIVIVDPNTFSLFFLFYFVFYLCIELPR